MRVALRGAMHVDPEASTDDQVDLCGGAADVARAHPHGEAVRITEGRKYLFRCRGQLTLLDDRGSLPHLFRLLDFFARPLR